MIPMVYDRAIGATTATSVVAVLVSERFVRDFAAEIPVTLLDSRVTTVADGTEHVMVCEFSTHEFDLPRAIRRVLPSIVRLDWIQTWTRVDETSGDGLLRVQTHGTPSAHTKGTTHLANESGEMRYRFDGHVIVDVPLLGNRFGRLIEENLVDAILDDQLKVLRRHLGVS